MRHGAVGLAIAVLAGGAVPTPAMAGLFNGDITFVGSGDFQGQTVATATQIDFGALGAGGGNDPTGSLGTPGQFLVLTAEGDLSPLLFTTGSIKDLTINPATAPVTAFLLDSFAGGTFSFDLTSLFVIDQTTTQLLLGGVGIANMTGFDPTPANFTFSADARSTKFSFSTGLSAVPEPATFGLLGAGLAMLGLVGRRRTAGRAA
jgi:hypothetical protein